MSIEIREPPIIADNPDLNLWLFELRQLLVSEISTFSSLLVSIKSSPTQIIWGTGGDGSWRIIRSDEVLSVEKKESGSWVSKAEFQAD